MPRSTDVARIVRDAGGSVIGKTRLQKLAFMLEAAGLGDGFSFDYWRFGPYSQELASATRDATLLGFIVEKEKPASWGGSVSTYSLSDAEKLQVVSSPRSDLARLAVQADSIELELAATALFLARQGEPKPWDETAKRKPDKARGGRLEGAQELYGRFRQLSTPAPLPDLYGKS